MNDAIRLGFVGLGNMGAALAGRFADAEYDITVFDVNSVAMESVVRRGARAGNSTRDVGDSAEVVFSCLPQSLISESVACELRGSLSCEVLVEMSTMGRPAIQHIAGCLGPEIQLLDCPISGGRQRAVEGTLSAIVAGAPILVERVRPLLDVVAKNIFVVGTQIGQAQVCKIANNAISANGLVVACEAIVLGVKAGLDAAVMIDAINACTGRNTATVDKFPRAILPRTFDYGASISTPAKDLQLFMDEARAQHVSALATSATAQLWAMAADRFGDRADFTLIIRMIEEWAGLNEDDLSRARR